MGSKGTLILAAIGISLAGLMWWAMGRDNNVGVGGIAPTNSTQESVAGASESTETSVPDISAPAALEEGADRVALKSEQPRAKEASAPLEANAGQRVTGVVVERDGAPVPFAEVEFRAGLFGMGPDSQRSTQSAMTNDKGRFELEFSAAGEQRVSVRAPGYAPLLGKDVVVPKGEDFDLGQLELSRGALLSGRVVDADGFGVEGARLFVDHHAATFRTFGGTRPGTPTATSTADGSFTIDQLACGPWKISVESDDHPDAQFDGVANDPGIEVGGLLFELEPGFTVRGRVLGLPSGEIEHLRVMAREVGREDGLFDLHGGRSAKLEPSGDFVVRGLRGETDYRLNLRVLRGAAGAGVFEFNGIGGDARSDSVQARAGDRGVELIYNTAASITFQVVDRATGDPITDMQVLAGIGWLTQLRDEDFKPLEHFEDGLVRVPNLFPRKGRNEVQLAISAVGYRGYEQGDILLNTGEELSLGVIELESAPVALIRVFDKDTGLPVQGAEVSLLPRSRGSSFTGSGGSMTLDISVEASSDGEGEREVITNGRDDSESGVTNSEGLAVLTSITGERVSLRVDADNYAVFSESRLKLPEDEKFERDVYLTRGGEVLVSVVNAAGEPLVGAKIEHRAPKGARDPMGLFASMHGNANVTNSRGEMLFEHLSEGEHKFRLSDGGGMSFADEQGGAAFFVGAGGGSDEPWSEVDVAEGLRANVLLQAPSRGALEGIVSEAGRPLAGAKLKLEKRSGGNGFSGLSGLPGMGGGMNATSDGAGRYAFDDVKEGEYKLVIDSSNRAMPSEFEVDIVDRTVELNVELPISIVEGRITDEDGEPLAGVEVWASKGSAGGSEVAMQFVMVEIEDDGGDEGGSVMTFGGDEAERARTNEDGYYVLRGVQPNVDLVIHASAEHMEEATLGDVNVAADAVRAGVDLVMNAAGSLSVKVVKADGSAGGFCMLNASYDAGQGKSEEEVPDVREAMGQGGKKTLTGLRPGRWTLNARGFQAGAAKSEDVTVEVIAGQSKAVELVMP